MKSEGRERSVIPLRTLFVFLAGRLRPRAPEEPTPGGRLLLEPWQRLRLAMGKLRRFVYHKLRRRATERKLERRRGECQRCGACCRLLFRCPYLVMENGQSGCAIYERRPRNCHVFPLDGHDLLERDFVSPKRRCGFLFERRP